MRILIVDDMPEMRKLIRQGLAGAGYDDIREAASGTEAMDKLDGVELVLTDIFMSGMGGISLVKEIRKMRGFRFIPIIAVTAENRLSVIERMLRSGVNDYIIKPFLIKILVEKVRSYEKKYSFEDVISRALAAQWDD